MQNLNINRAALSDRVATAYKELFSSRPVVQGQVIESQMPDEQLHYFIRQSLDRHYFVRLQFKSVPDVAPATASGYLSEDAAGHLVLKQDRRLTTIVAPRLLRSIQRY
ncbi:hypothetical protein ACFQET_05940 [Levilactobacillus tangyuanensis]|uniref:Uncharacterized protein n=1 Tax=Levilactobacillus tangyuanensis TaxID=2486021 RepID=A0ABW1TNJ7_9LACO|nr:hypothetical protein [Levilactobacillus tangyuanensis]